MQSLKQEQVNYSLPHLPITEAQRSKCSLFVTFVIEPERMGRNNGGILLLLPAKSLHWSRCPINFTKRKM
jgi:hypothetical protein